MRAIVLLCLMHAAYSEGNMYSWYGPVQTPKPVQTTRFPEPKEGHAFRQDKLYSWDGPVQAPKTVQTTLSPEPNEDNSCLMDQTSCGCCLMLKQIERMEQFINITQELMFNELTRAKDTLNNMRASQSAFSVALKSDDTMKCSDSLTKDKNIVYEHVFLNLGGGYDVGTGIFTVPLSGVYSFAVTLYGNAGVTHGDRMSTCANLLVNTQVVATLHEQNGLDLEDSATVFLAMKVKAGDQVAVNMLKGCFICDDNNNHQNTFTGFLLYSTD